MWRSPSARLEFSYEPRWKQQPYFHHRENAERSCADGLMDHLTCFWLKTPVNTCWTHPYKHPRQNPRGDSGLERHAREPEVSEIPPETGEE